MRISSGESKRVTLFDTEDETCSMQDRARRTSHPQLNFSEPGDTLHSFFIDKHILQCLVQ